MKKRILTLLLTLALGMGLAVPALAEYDVTSKDLLIGGTHYPLDTSASGTGWSYDGKYTLTLSGYDSGTDIINVNNPSQQVNVALAAGTTNKTTLYLIYAYGSTREQALSISGTGSLTCNNLMNPTLSVREATIHTGEVAAVESFTMDSGNIFSGKMTLDAGDVTLNGGSIVLDRSEAAAEAEANDLIKYWDDVQWSVLKLTADSLDEANAVVRQFRGADGQALVAKKDSNPYAENQYYACHADGTPADYATFGGTSSQPSAPAQPAAKTAYATSYSILVDGKSVAFDAYALKDANGNDTNYLKLRDVAHVLDGSKAQFNVGWDGSANAISITTGTAYASPNGSEMSTPFSGNQSYTQNQAAVLVDGAQTGLEAITITDAGGNGYTYFKLRDLGAALGFNVIWDAAAGAIVIDTTQPYQA